MIPHYTPDLFCPEALADPSPHHRALRELGPLVWLEAQSMYVLPRFEQVRAAGADPVAST